MLVYHAIFSLILDYKTDFYRKNGLIWPRKKAIMNIPCKPLPRCSQFFGNKIMNSSRNVFLIEMTERRKVTRNIWNIELQEWSLAPTSSCVALFWKEGNYNCRQDIIEYWQTHRHYVIDIILQCPQRVYHGYHWVL